MGYGYNHRRYHDGHAAIAGDLFNPFMPGDLLDDGRLDLPYFKNNNFEMKHKFDKY